MPSKPPTSTAQKKKAIKTAKKLPDYIRKRFQRSRKKIAEEEERWASIEAAKRVHVVVDSDGDDHDEIDNVKETEDNTCQQEQQQESEKKVVSFALQPLPQERTSRKLERIQQPITQKKKRGMNKRQEKAKMREQIMF